MIQLVITHGARLSLIGLLLALFALLGVLASIWSAFAALCFTFLVATLVTALVLWQQRQATLQTASGSSLQQRLQQQDAVLETGTAAWCLFNREGVLLRHNLRQHNLFDQQLRHFDELVALFEDGVPLMENFRHLQKSGQAFDVQLTSVRQGQRLQIKGYRTSRYGAEHYCVLQINPVAPTPVAVVAAVTEPPVSLQPAPSLLEVLPFPLWRRDAAQQLVWVNAAYASWVGHAATEAIAGQIELAPQNPVAANRIAGAKVVTGRKLALKAVVKGIAQHERAYGVVAGQRRLLEISELPVPQADEGGMGTLGYALDMTAAQELQDELQRHIGAHHEVLENLATPITIYGADQRLEFYNRAYIRLWDHNEEFLASKPSFGEILEDLRARRRAPEQVDFQRYKRERLGLFTTLLEPREDMLHLPDGTALRVVAVPHPFGGLMFLHEDVTDKLALESSYNTLIAVQRETLDNLAEGIAVFGADGRLKLFNPAYAQIWRLPVAALLEEPHINDLIDMMHPLLPPDQSQSFRSAMVACALQRAEQDGRFVRQDGSIISYHTVPLPDGAMLNSYVDVTDTLRVEQALRESNAALATADRLKSEFVANVSYQLRTPLNTIMGFAEILANQYFGTLNERQLEYARTIMESSKRLKLLIDDVIDLAMVDAGRMSLNRRTVAIVPLLQTVVGMMGEWARQQSLELLVDAENGIGNFAVDDKRIKQVLFNLVSNAIQYTPPGGRITLQARREIDMIRLSVIDTGIGIPEQDQGRIWDKFERSNAQSRQSGAGLGLSLVKSFITLHGGHITISSQINRGTQVNCFLPIVPPTEAVRHSGSIT